MREEVFVAGDDQHLICTLWDDVKNPIGVVQLIHGMDEHIGRYDRFARFLNRHGYIVFGDDHRAHGRTAGTPDKIGRVGDNHDLFQATMRDELEIMRYLRRRFALPLLLFGHSYGSFIAQRLISDTNICTAGVCLSGSAKYPEWMLEIARGLAWAGVKLHGADAPAKFLELFSPIRGKKNGVSRLTRDAAQAAAHDADPMRAEYFSYGFYYSLFDNLLHLQQKACTETPLLIISGGDDLVSFNSKFAKSLYRAYKAQDLRYLTFIVYPGARHELLMETNYEEVQHDILDFFNSAIKKQSL